MYELMDNHNEEAVIKVFGVGGGGGNAVDHMVKESIEGVDFIAANTDAQALRNSAAGTTLQIGTEVTKGLGAGANPEVGRQSALEDRENIAAATPDMAFALSGFQQALKQLEACTGNILNQCANAPDMAQAVASPYLRLFATICGGWLMCKSHAKALSQPQGFSSAFLTQKTASTGFYLTQIMPECAMLAAQVENCLDPAFTTVFRASMLDPEISFAN